MKLINRIKLKILKIILRNSFYVNSLENTHAYIGYTYIGDIELKMYSVYDFYLFR